MQFWTIKGEGTLLPLGPLTLIFFINIWLVAASTLNLSFWPLVQMPSPGGSSWPCRPAGAPPEPGRYPWPRQVGRRSPEEVTEPFCQQSPQRAPSERFIIAVINTSCSASGEQVTEPELKLGIHCQFCPCCLLYCCHPFLPSLLWVNKGPKKASNTQIRGTEGM